MMKKLNKKYFFLFFSIFVCFISCKQTTNDKLDKKLSKEFYNSIENQNAKKFEFNYDGLTPQESYFIGGKIKYLKFRQNPELGFSEGKIVFNLDTDSIEKYILRIVTPDRESYNDNIFEEYFDTIYIFNPTENKTLTFSKNKIIDSIFRPYINDWNVKYVYKMKHITEKKYNSKINSPKPQP